MPYEAACPKGHRLQVTEGHFGQRVTCPTCGEAFVVPDLGKAAASSTPPPQPAGKVALDTRRWKPSLEMVSGLVAGRPVGRPPPGGPWLGPGPAGAGGGCDGVGQRGVQRAEAKVQAARDELADELPGQAPSTWKKRSPSARKTAIPRPRTTRRLTDLKTQLTDLAARSERPQEVRSRPLAGPRNHRPHRQDQPTDQRLLARDLLHLRVHPAGHRPAVGELDGPKRGALGRAGDAGHPDGQRLHRRRGLGPPAAERISHRSPIRKRGWPSGPRSRCGLRWSPPAGSLLERSCWTPQARCPQSAQSNPLSRRTRWSKSPSSPPMTSQRSRRRSSTSPWRLTRTTLSSVTPSCPTRASASRPRSRAAGGSCPTSR